MLSWCEENMVFITLKMKHSSKWAQVFEDCKHTGTCGDFSSSFKDWGYSTGHTNTNQKQKLHHLYTCGNVKWDLFYCVCAIRIVSALVWLPWCYITHLKIFFRKKNVPRHSKELIYVSPWEFYLHWQEPITIFKRIFLLIN